MAKSCPIVYGPIIVGLAQKSVLEGQFQNVKLPIKIRHVMRKSINLQIQDHFSYKKGLFSIIHKSNIQKLSKFSWSF